MVLLDLVLLVSWVACQCLAPLLIYVKVGRYDELCFAAMTYVDNAFFVSHSAYGATFMAHRFEVVLRAKWLQEIKPSSRELLVVSGKSALQ